MESNAKLKHVVLLRALTIILVVLGHATKNSDAPGMYLYTPLYTPFFEIALSNYIYSFHMPLFFWISGYVFYFSTGEKRHQVSPIKELSKKIQRLIIPLYATAFLVLLPTILFFGHPDGSLLHICKKFMLGKDIHHLWFLKSLFYIFIVVIPICNYTRKLNLFWGAVFCISIMVFSMSGIIFPSFFRDLLFFLLGYFTRKFSGSFTKQNPLYPFSILFISHFAFFLATQLNLIPRHFNLYLRYFTPLLGIYFMYYFTVYLSKFTFRESIWDAILLIDRTSYTIYLFHSTFVFFVLYIYSFSPSSNVLIRILPSFLLGILIPPMIHSILSRIRYVSFLFGIAYSVRKTNDIK